MKIQIFYRVYSIALLFAVQIFQPSFGRINFGAKSSEIIIDNTSVLKVKANTMAVQQGGINRTFLGVISGNPIQFDRGVFKSFNSVSDISGSLINSSGAGVFQLGDTPSTDDINIIIANPGGLPINQSLIVKPGASFLRGQPLFFGPNAITLTDESTILAIAIQNALNTNVTLNGGIIVLQDDLSLGDDSVFLGDGRVVFNNRRLSLGGSASIWDGFITWDSANDLQLNSNTTLNGIWFFVGDGQINGNGNVLDIANGGVIIIAANSRLRLSGVVLKGLGTGALFMGNGAELRLSDVDIEMNTDYTINSGGVFIDGSTNIITKDNIFRIADSMDSHGSLTVDRVALTYDTLDFLDNLNIRPQRINDPNHKFIEIINNGSIRRIRQEPITFLDYSSDAAVQRYAIISPQRHLRVFPEIDDVTRQLKFNFDINGVSNFFGFTRTDDPIMFISDDVHVRYRNVHFRDFSPIHLSLGANASLVFGDKATVQFGRDEKLNYPLVFEGNTILKGGGAILTLEGLGALELRGKNSALTIENMTIKGLSDDQIRVIDPSSKVIFKDVKLIQDNNFTFSVGAIDVLNDLTLIGPFEFKYTATGPFRILSDSTLLLLREKIFTYAPTDGNRNLFQMVDVSATIDINNITISAPAPGFQLIHGRLIVRNRNFLQNDGGSSAADGIVFGNGNPADNVITEQSGDASLEVISGFFEDQSVTL